MTMTKGSGSSEEQNDQEENQNNPTQKLSEEQLLKIVTDQQKAMADLQAQMKAMSEGQSSNVAFNVDAMKQMAEFFVKAQAGLANGGKGIPEKPTKEDWDEEGVRFAAPFVGYLVTGEERNGMPHEIPFGKQFLFFDYAATRKVQQGKYMSTAPFSVYHSHSKKEIEFLKNHSMFNIQFFASANANMLGDEHIKLQKLNRIMQVLKNYELPDLWKAAKDHKLDIIEDNIVLRNNLAHAMLQKEMDLEMAPQMRSMADVLNEKKIADNVKAKA